MIESGLGYGSKFAVLPPDHALPSLVAREREIVSRREKVADQLARQLASVVASGESGHEEPIQIIRNPKVFTERFDRLQLEAERQVDMIVKAPILNPRKDNPAQAKAQRRGIHFRSLYESAVLQDPQIQPYVAGWIAAGEEARVYDGELPYKLVVFDAQAVLLALRMPGDQLHSLLIRHDQLAGSLSMLFEFLWERATPLTAKSLRRTPTVKQGASPHPDRSMRLKAATKANGNRQRRRNGNSV